MTLVLPDIATLPGSAHDVIRTHRQAALDILQAAGLPEKRDEDWKYTDISRVRALLESTDTAVIKLGSANVEAAMIPGLDAYRLVIAGGRFLPGLSSELPKGVKVATMADLFEHDPERSLAYFDVPDTAPLFNGFVAMNAALASDGISVRIADGIRLDKPLCVIHLGNGEPLHIRHSIMLGRQAEAELIEQFVGEADSGLTNIVTRIRLAEGAQLSHYRIQKEGARQFHVGRLDVAQSRDSRYISHAVALGAALSRLDVSLELNEPGAACELNGLYLTDGRQHSDHHTCVRHLAPYCSSRENYRGVLSGRSHAVFNGKIVVAEGAVKTDSAQSNANLLLSKQAEIDTKPELEIYNDDVKCAHGVTVGQLDANQLFYLQSRGLSEAEAREVLTVAFADTVVAAMANADVRSFVEKVAFTKIPHGESAGELLHEV